jgi:LysM repeat protein
MNTPRYGSHTLIFLAGLAFTVGFLLAGPVSQMRAQGIPTATPDAEGVIYVIVQPNDSLWALAAGAGVSLQDLLAYNNLTEDDIIQPGQVLIIGYGTPAPTATVELPTATPTATRLPPTPTQTAEPPPRTAICLKAFIDNDRDGTHDVGEPFRTAVAFTVFNEETVVGNYITDGVSEPYCLEDLSPGDYKITRSIARDETLTTAGNWALTLTRGNVLNLEFGSYQKDDATVVTANTPEAVTEPTIAAESEVASQSDIPGDDRGLGGLAVAGFIVVGILLLGGGLLLARRAKPSISKR